MTKPHHREIEVKLDATEVAVEDFMEYIRFKYGLKRYEPKLVKGSDYYFTNKQGHVLRYRTGSDWLQELTVKRRSSKVSTIDRLEIDLKLNNFANLHDVSAWAEALGFELSLPLYKESVIYEFKYAPYNVGVTIVMYDVKRIGSTLPPVQFLEVELAKDQSDHPNAREIVGRIAEDLVTNLPGVSGKRLNYSLYEFFSGNKYLVEGE
jgi:adenylate cyclase class IV